MIISFCNQKGGVGKTTLTINITSYIANRFKKKHKVLLIDADPQGSVLQWQSITDSTLFDVIHSPDDTLHKGIKKLSKKYSHIIIDAPPGAGDITLSILLSSEIVIIPVEPSALSIWSSSEIIDLINEAKKHNKKLKGYLLISRKITGTTPGKEAREALKTYGMPIFKTEISQRVAFVKALIEGKSVLEYKKSSAAANEIKALGREIVIL